VTRHLGHQQGVRQSGMTTQESPLDMSNIRIVCPTCDKPSRIGTRILEDGSKVRVCKACDEVLE
jgi:large subunit ribosomal protein L24